MATSFILTTIAQTTDAFFRAWGSEVNGQFTAAGLVQTADTGQINWLTVTAPTAISTAQGYEIWRFNDTLQSTVPIYLKFEYGSGSSSASTNPVITLTIGTGSNGLGTITGIFFARTQISVNAVLTSNVILYPSCVCYNSTYGFLGFFLKKGCYSGNNLTSFMMGRTVDQATGLPNSIGLWWVYAFAGSAAIVSGSVNFTSGSVITTGVGNICTIFGAPGTSFISGGTNLYRPAFAFPTVYGANQFSLGISIPDNSLVTATSIGSLSLTYISCVTLSNWTSNNVSTYQPLMLWQ